MERRGSKGVAPEPRARRYADQPSFSSTLLDAIYKSMDEPTDAAAAAETMMTSKTKKRAEESVHYNCHHHHYKPSLAGSYRGSSSRVTSSSSDCSSYGGFSSSEAESSHHHRRLRPIRTTTVSGGGMAAPAPEKKKTAHNKEKPGAAIRAKLRDLRGKPASPGARLAGFLNSIFAGGGHKQRTPPPSSSRGAAESACSTASSSYSRSCLSKTPSTRGQPRRTVRFLDADVDAATAAERRNRVQQVGVVHLEQMLLRRMEMESDDEDDEDSSDASSDLFELENLSAVAPAAAAAYRDELPVYETTRVRGIGHGYAHGRSTATVV
ncbi:hypothetical protein PR202_gb18753 [Eleusine coracana subsp. coracana]|uniref:Uncharacterized protein n=1 Tax=Eleusine coracana subsp. coracana TaxID=191504 RepID=A0AAV5F7T9_ELECO|nr:hypothetical protein QOZ80_3BG0292370 [Eleusine coracana subsp. coracana]GJN30445.1 hypothetical protein PR202_gb18753 [Eleusine coracana subsp. coracana]